MKNPQPGVIALFCEAVGLKVVAIRRIRIGGVSIGKCRWANGATCPAKRSSKPLPFRHRPAWRAH
jgi:16S rRNA U516 pseudouridylate synthase RsuA-like enzyme